MTAMSRLPSLGPRGEGWVAIQFVLLGAIAGAGWWTGPDWGGPARTVSVAVGLALIAAGGILAARGLLDLRSALTPMPHPRDGAELVETGVYRLVRHHIYGGLIVAALGWGLVRASVASLLLAGLLTAFFVLKSMREEAWLVRSYPRYAAYRTRTRRFIPWIG